MLLATARLTLREFEETDVAALRRYHADPRYLEHYEKRPDTRRIVELAAMPPVAVAGVLNCVVGTGTAPLDEALAAARAAVLKCGRTKDQIEGMRAFMEKRRPVFNGE